MSPIRARGIIGVSKVGDKSRPVPPLRRPIRCATAAKICHRIPGYH